MEKIQETFNKDLEEVKRKQMMNNTKMKLKILYKESTAEKLRQKNG